ncbi:MAG: DUF4013 domain-containing protein [Coriobacteriia bacterium]
MKSKLALGALIALIPYVGFVWVFGWQLEYQRNVAWGYDKPLPEWSGFSRQALLGLKALLAVLPYSLVMSLFIISPMMAASTALAFRAESAAEVQWPLVAMFIAAMVVFPMALGLLILPLTASTMLRVSLYGTLESGFEFKEIFRLMRERKPELRKVWGYAVLNAGISLGATIVFFGLVAVVMILLPGSWEQKLLPVLLLGALSYLVYIVLALALSLYLGLVNMHLFGSYGRVLYRLEEQQAELADGLTSAST